MSEFPCHLTKVHRFEPRYSERIADGASVKTYECDVCVKCGKIAQRVPATEQGAE